MFRQDPFYFVLLSERSIKGSSVTGVYFAGLEVECTQASDSHAPCVYGPIRGTTVRKIFKIASSSYYRSGSFY